MFLLCHTAISGERFTTYSISFHPPATLDLCHARFDLSQDAQLARFAIHAEKIIFELQEERKAFENHSREILARQSDLPQAEINRLQREESRSGWKKDIRGIAAMVRLAKTYRQTSPASRPELQQEIIELASAVANNHRSPTPRYVGIIDAPVRFLLALRHPVAKGTNPASNLVPGGSADLSLADPVPSTYWKRPTSLASLDLYTGFGRAALPRFDDRIWNYAGPKKVGRNPGYELLSGEQRLKVKFSEIHSEPFISKLSTRSISSITPFSNQEKLFPAQNSGKRCS
jgi:hypothetical protein